MSESITLNSNYQGDSAILSSWQSIDKEQYKICQQRGHVTSEGFIFNDSPTHYRCKFCNTPFHYENRLIEDVEEHDI